MLSAMEYPHWLMVAGAVLVVFGFVGIEFLKSSAEPAEDNLGQEVTPPEERAQLRSRLTALVDGSWSRFGRARISRFCIYQKQR